jgi:hypothetical protein
VNAASRPLLLAVALTAAVGAVGCGSPASVEGVFSARDFRLDCDVPLAKSTASGRDMIIVLSEHDRETLSTVNISLPGLMALPEGVEIEVGASVDEPRPMIDVVVGDLLVETRADGVEILSPVNARRASSVGGHIILESRSADGVVGRFRVDLDDGGYLEGSFVAAASAS